MTVEPAQFTIPAEFQDQLRHVPPLDTRTDAEILASLELHAPVTSEKNIWAFWNTGLRSMPPWCMRNVLAWIRLCGPSWTVRVLDSVPDSPNYALRYLDADMLPDAFVKGSMYGPYVGPHSADFLRGACLYLHGGVFMDVGNMLFRDLDRVCWNKLADPECPYEVAVPCCYDTLIANHFVASRKGNVFIKAWHDLFIHFWKGHQTHEGIFANPLLAFAQNFNYDGTRAANFKWDFKVPAATAFEYISQILAWMRLCAIRNTGRGFDGVEYWTNKVFVFDALKEDWSIDDEFGFRGTALFEALSTRLDAPKDSQRYKDAYRAVWRALTQSSLQKITHGKGLTHTPALGVLWELDGNEGADNEDGTFARLLRYGSVYFEQTRDSISTMEVKPPNDLLNVSLFEA